MSSGEPSTTSMSSLICSNLPNLSGFFANLRHLCRSRPNLGRLGFSSPNLAEFNKVLDNFAPVLYNRRISVEMAANCLIHHRLIA